MISIAIPRGRLFGESVDLLFSKGILKERVEEGRRLTVEAGDITLLLVKPFDVPVYVENGTADIGVCGLQIPGSGNRTLQNIGSGEAGERGSLLQKHLSEGSHKIPSHYPSVLLPERSKG